MSYFLTLSCLFAFSSYSSATDAYGALVYAPRHASVDYYAYPRYAFEYAVRDPHTGDNKAQWERRDGDVVKGAYSLVEPDGHLRIVEYYADDKSGFNAVVKRIGPSLHPTTVHAAPIYRAPIPVLSETHAPVAPISIGSVPRFEGLARAPLLHGGAISTSAVIREPVVPIVRPLAPAPIIPAPVISAPMIPAPIRHAPIVVPSAPVLSAPYLREPVLSRPMPLDDLGHGFLERGPLLLDRAPMLSNGYSGSLGYPHGPRHY